MIFIIRTDAGSWSAPDIRRPPLDIKMLRRTPAIVGAAPGRIDVFCDGDPEAAKAAGWPVVAVHDGWYADDGAGGMAIWGQGLFWEVRDTPFTIRQACGPEAWPQAAEPDKEAAVNIRRAIFQG